MIAPLVVCEISKVPLSTTPDDAAMVPLPASPNDAPALMVVVPV